MSEFDDDGFSTDSPFAGGGRFWEVVPLPPLPSLLTTVLHNGSSGFLVQSTDSVSFVAHDGLFAFVVHSTRGGGNIGGAMFEGGCCLGASYFAAINWVCRSGLFRFWCTSY